MSCTNTRSGDLGVHASGEAIGTDIEDTMLKLKLMVFVARLFYSPDI